MNLKKLKFSKVMAFTMALLMTISSFTNLVKASNDKFSDKNLVIPEFNNLIIKKQEYKYSGLDRTGDMINTQTGHPEVDDRVKADGGNNNLNSNSKDTVAGERDTRLGGLDNVSKPGIQNTGDVLDPSALASAFTVKPYSPKLYGKVEFSLFKLDRNDTTLQALLPDVTYEINMDDMKQKEVSQSQMRAVKRIGDEIEAAYEAGLVLPYGATKVESGYVNENGEYTFSHVKTYDLVNGKKISNNYIVLETVHPNSVVAKSYPLFVSLPITNTDGTYAELQGTPYKEDVVLYPKNEVREQSFGFKKYKNDFEGTEGLDSGISKGKNELTNLEKQDGTLEGAEFVVYKGNPKDYDNYTNNHVLGNQNGAFVLKTDANGQIDVSGLVRGSYYLVEKEVADLIDGVSVDATKYQKRDGFKYLAGFDALNNKYNILTFNMGADGKIRYGSELDQGRVLDKLNVMQYINHFIPDFDKELIAYTDGTRTLEQGFDYFENIPFKVTLTVPDNIYQYSKFEFKDQLEREGAADPEIGDNVEPSDHVEFVRGTDGKILFDITTDKGDVLERGVDYFVVDQNEDGANNRFKISFANPAKASLTAETTTPENNRFTEKVRNAEMITVKYHAQLNAKADPDVLYNNRAEFTYNNAPEEGLTKDRYNHDREDFKTYGRRFVKKDAGLWLLNQITPNKQSLEGAEFIVKNAEGKYFNGYTHTQNTVGGQGNGTLEPVWVEFSSDKEAFDALRAATNPNRGDAILKSNNSGEFEIKGIKQGTYTLVEMKAPIGYRLPLNPETEFEVGQDTYTETTTLRHEIDNERTPEMPLTGSDKTAIAVITGASVIVLGFVAYVIYKKKYKEIS